MYRTILAIITISMLGVIIKIWTPNSSSLNFFIAKIEELIKPLSQKSQNDLNPINSTRSGQKNKKAAETLPSASEPILKIETGYHAAIINKISLTRKNQLITVSDDKTGRLWSDINEPDKVLRVPIGPHSEGALYAVASSPIKDMAVVGGSTGLNWDNTGVVYSFDLNSGEIIGRLPGIPGSIQVLNYSKNGQYLAIGTSTGLVRVIDLATKSLANQNNDCPDSVTSIEYLNDNQFLTACMDGNTRLYDANFQLIAIHQLAKKKRPWRMAISPNQLEVAIGTLDADEIEILTINNLTAVNILKPNRKLNGAFSSVVWANDSLLGAGTYGDKSGEKLIHSWNLKTGEQSDFSVSKDSITDLLLHNNNELVYTTAEATIGKVLLNNLENIKQPRLIPDFRDAYQGIFTLSKDGTVLEIGKKQGGKQPFKFSFPERMLYENPQNDKSLYSPIIPKTATNWRNSLKPVLFGKPIELAENELSRAISGSENGQFVVLGSDYSLRLFKQEQIFWNIPLQSPAWAVNLSRDGRFVVAALGDGTVHWFNLNDASEAMALFITADNRWIAWTPEGYFDYSVELVQQPQESSLKRGLRPVRNYQRLPSNLIGYHINRGHKATPEFILSEQIQNNFYRPDLVFKKFQTLSGTTNNSGNENVKKILSNYVPPVLKSLAWCDQENCNDIDFTKRQTVNVNNPEIKLRYEIADQGSGIGDVILKRNGAAVAKRGLRVSQTGSKQTTHEEKLLLEPGDNPISFTVFDENKFVQSKEDYNLTFHFEGLPKIKPSLYILSIGINSYQSTEINKLINAVNDASGINSLMQSQREHFKEIISKVLIEDQATRKNIEDNLKLIATDAKPDDRVIIFLAGHGVVIDGHYYFLPYEIKSSNNDEIKAKAISDNALSDLISNISTLQVAVLIDSCFAGSLASSDIVTQRYQDATWTNSLGQNTGRFFLAGSANNQEALDGINGHGVFTSVLIDALKGKADLEIRGNKNKKVDVVELSEYAKQYVPIAARKIDPSHTQKATGFFMGSDFFELVDVKH